MSKVEVRMPKMGESITEGTVLEWHKQPGDTVEMDESLLEIGTDKVDTEVPSPSAGILAEILVEEGATVDVGTVIAMLETDVAAVNGGMKAGSAPEAPAPAPQASVPAPQATAPATATPPAAAAPPEAAPPAAPPAAAAPSEVAPPATAGTTTDVLMPKMGESIMEGTVLEWHKKPGDSIDLDESLLEIATDKVDTDVPSPVAGIVQQVLVPEGETVDVGTLIAVIASGEASEVATDRNQVPASPPASPVIAPAISPTATVSTPASGYVPTAVQQSDVSGPGDAVSRHDDTGRFLSPLVRSIAEKEHLSVLELSSINGTGHGGRVTKSDVLTYVEAKNSGAHAAPAGLSGAAAAETSSASAVPAAEPSRRILSSSAPVPQKAPGDRVEVIPMDRMRQLISEHMTHSKSTSAHVTSFAEVDVSKLVRLRERNKAAFLEREGVKLTYTPFFVYAAVEALRDHPMLNCSVVDKEIHLKKDFHIGIAVAIGKKGLVVPVIHDAGQKNIAGLAHAAADLATRARSKKLMPDDLQRGTFTVTNVGSLGSIMGTPIINQPQVGILATGAIKKRPVVIEDPVLGDTIGIRSMMYVSLSYDHRIVDGAMASSFLARYVEVLGSFDATEVI